MISNPQLELAHNFVEYTNKNIFLTGKAGTGKTTFLRNLVTTTSKRSIVVAPTGVAAINARGVTIHSFFQMPFGPYIPGTHRSNDAKGSFIRMSKTKINIIKSLDLLIIDEVSMVRSDLLDGIDESLRRYRKNSLPFGGVQLLMIGDIQQLSPVVKENEWNMLRGYYHSPYFYSSLALQKSDYVSIELKHIYRQSDNSFIQILNKIRDNQIDSFVLDKLNQRYDPNILSSNNDGYITLTTHNAKAQSINQQKLSQIDKPGKILMASVNGEFPEYSYPTDQLLELKEGAQVMFIKNDSSPEKLFYNGKIGVVDSIDKENDVIFVACSNEDDLIPVNKASWENYKYDIDEETKEINESVIGKFIQFPLKLAWAITIHKSQGLTFDKAIIDAQSSFAHGQVYVALSRCRSLEGVVLSSKLQANSVRTDSNVIDFCQQIEQNSPSTEQLKDAQKEFQVDLLKELFNFQQLKYRTSYCLRVAQNNAMSLLTDIAGMFSQIEISLQKEIISVSEKFQNQLQSMTALSSNIENDSSIQERIIRASDYFYSQINSVINSKLNSIKISTDNKKAKKEITTAIDNLTEELNVKIACLKLCKEGFLLQKFLKTKAEAAINEPSKRKSKASEKTVSIEGIEHPDLFEILRQWRNQVASMNNKRPYQLFHQKSLVEIADKLPESLTDLNNINGIGKKKAEEYGPMVLEIISSYCKKHDIAYNPHFEFKKKAPKTDTKKMSFDLYHSGKSIDDIAKERQLSPVTIHGHIAHYIELGEIEITAFLSKIQVEEITSAIEEFDTQQLAPLKAGLDDKYEYDQLRMAVAHYQYLKTKNH